VPGWTPGYNNFVDVRDVARGMIAAWQRGRRGERYILGGHNMTYRAIMTTIAEVAGVKPPRLGMPRPLAALAGRFGDLAERVLDRDPLITSTTVRYAYTEGFQFASDKAVAQLGYTISSVEPAIRDAIEWFRGHRMLPS
jgi:dihydroflavonol-4-reductase